MYWCACGRLCAGLAVTTGCRACSACAMPLRSGRAQKDRSVTARRVHRSTDRRFERDFPSTRRALPFRVLPGATSSLASSIDTLPRISASTSTALYTSLKMATSPQSSVRSAGSPTRFRTSRMNRSTLSSASGSTGTVCRPAGFCVCVEEYLLTGRVGFVQRRRAPTRVSSGGVFSRVERSLASALGRSTTSRCVAWPPAPAICCLIRAMMLAGVFRGEALHLSAWARKGGEAGPRFSLAAIV